jgi:type I restriction enzyme S subunit
MIAAILNHAITTGVPHVNLSILGNLKLLLPPLSVQRSISAVLSALDDKIAVNDRVARASYDLAQAHFLASVQNDARTIFLRDIIDLRYGKALTKNNREPGTVPVFGGNGISGQHSQALSSGPGIIVGRKGANAGSVSWCQGPFWVIDTGFFVDPISRNTPLEYLYFLLQEVGFRSQVGDSAIPGLNREIALACTVMLPPEEVICGVTFKVRPLLELHTHISDESASLAKLRDALLPKLMSGEIRVGDAERIVGDAT